MLIGFAGLAIDVSILFHGKRTAQAAADAAAIAGIQDANYGTALASARHSASQNGVTNGVNGAAVSLNTPPQYGAYRNRVGYAEAVVILPQPTFFIGAFRGLTSMNVTARAVAGITSAGGGCIYALGNSGIDFSANGNANLSMPTCGLTIDSSSNNALSVNGNINLSANYINVVGGVSKNGNISISPTPVTGVLPTSDPLAYLQAPSPSGCSADPNLNGNTTTTISPGCYNGISINGNSQLTLSAGTYVVNGGFNLNGNATITGTGVTLIFLGSTSFNGNVTLNLTAPTTGTYNGLLFFQPSSNVNSLTLNGNAGSVLHGIMYFPAAALTMNGNAGMSIYTDLVVKSLAMNGNVSFQDYAAINPASPLASIGLVE